MNYDNIREGLKAYDKDKVDIYLAYINKLSTEKKKDKGQYVIKNPWMQYKKDHQIIDFFKVVESDGLMFDGIDVTLQQTGISYSYQAFKNKMLISYPESIIDVSLVYVGDTVSFDKNSGSIKYNHKIGDPFNQTDNNMIGAYCVIKNKRGEFLTLLSSADISNHRKVAKTDSIWKNWPKEMALKTIMKKACKQHFKDIYQNIETIDNKNYDLDQPMDIEIEHKAKVEEITTIDDLSKFYHENIGTVTNKEDFNKLVSARKEQLTNGDS